ncbi:MAG: hypothetical protein ACOX6O_11430 [Christensenellales bacterium]|jgi:hypothetical protein
MEVIQLSPHQQASKAYNRHLTAIVLQLIVQLLLRVVALSPLLYAGINGKFFGVKADHVMAAAAIASLPLYLLIVMPFRYCFFAKLSGYLGYRRQDSVIHYGKWLAAGFYRLLRALPFLVPFIAFAVLYYYYMRVADLTQLPILIMNLGALVGGSFTEGTAILVLIGLCAFLLAFLGWRRGLLFECQPIVEHGINASWRKSRQGRKLTGRVSLINFLLCLPGLIAMGAVLSVNLAQDLTGSIFEKMLSLLPAILNANFPPATYYQLLIALLVAYLPFLPFRKLALSAIANEA